MKKNIKNYQNFTKTLKKSDLVVIGWGWLFFDNEWTVSSLKNLNTWIFRKKLASYYKKPVVFYGVWINFQNDENVIFQKKIDAIFSSANSIYVRDNFSHNYLKKLWISSEIILDPVHHDKKKFKDKKNLSLGSKNITDFSRKDLEKLDFNGKTVGFALRKLEIENYEKIIIETLEYIIQKWWQIIILPHSFHKHDPSSNDFLFFKELLMSYYNISDFTLENHKLKLSHSMEETYNYYREKELDIVLASRLHSIILSKVYKIPFYWLSYSKKTDEQLEKN